MQISTFKRAPHPPYSPDIAPSDFYLFGYVKGRLSGRCFKSRNELIEAISSIINEISPSKRREVFEEWKDRCKWVYMHEGTYFQK